MSSGDSISAEIEAMRQRILAGEPIRRSQTSVPPEQRRNPTTPYVRPSRAKPKTANRRGENLRDRPPSVSRVAIREAHARGLHNVAIAKEVGCHHDTVRVALDEMGLVANPSPTPGPQRRDMCPAGLHDMEVHGRETDKGRYCRPCKTTRERLKREAQRSIEKRS